MSKTYFTNSKTRTYGFDIKNGRYFNEDGNDNELTADVAGWLNYFLNGVNVVHGSGLNDELGTGACGEYFANARNETFLAGAGNDKIWATMDSVDGFQSGTDKIDLRAMGAMTFEELDYVAGGNKSCYYDGHFLRIDYTGDGATDMMVEFKYLADLSAKDFVFI